MYGADVPLILSIVTALVYVVLDWVSIELVLQFSTKNYNRGFIVNNVVRRLDTCYLYYFWDFGVVIG